MILTDNTILVTGGGSGIGRGLAEALLKLGNRVIIAGRRQAALDDTLKANPGMAAVTLDVESPAAIVAFAQRMEREFPTLNVLINNAGIMRRENLLVAGADPANNDADAIVVTNLLGPIRLTTALLPLLRRHPRSMVMNVTSGLAFMPLAMTPTYCATKAALHSYTLSLRYQLRGTNTQIVELVPPYVQTDLLGGANDPRAMPLKDYIQEVMAILTANPESTEICVERVKPIRFAPESGRFDEAFKAFNDAMVLNPH